MFGNERDKVRTVWSPVLMSVCSELFPNASPPSISLTGDTDFTLSPHVARTMLCRHSFMVHPRLHSVSLNALSRVGFDGWWSPMEKQWGCMHLGDYNILLVRSTAWDGAPGGWLQAIMRDIPRKDQGRLRDFFRDYNHLPGVVGELRRPPEGTPTPLPAVPVILLSRFKDNLYVVCLHIPEHLQSLVREALCVFLHFVYGVRLKWEPHTAVATWGEGRLAPSPLGSLVLLRKPCTVTLDGDTLAEEWCKWVDRWSPQCRLVCGS